MKTKKAYNFRHFLSLQAGGYVVGGSPQRRPPPPFRKGFPSTLPPLPPKRLSKAHPDLFVTFFSPSVFLPPPNYLTLPGAYPRPPKSLSWSAPVWGAPTGEIGRGQAARKAAFVHRPQQLTLVTRNAMASSLQQAAAQWGEAENWSPRQAGDLSPTQINSRSSAARWDMQGPASDLNPAPLPPYWPVRGTRSLLIGGCGFPRECVSRAIPRDVREGAESERGSAARPQP